jgi:microcystin-dependent protein
MASPFMGEIRMFSLNYPPQGWALCNGQLLPINQNQPLFALLGTMYGGNGQTTFALPDLRGRVPIHVGGGFILGQNGGEASHTVSISELPSHIHAAMVTNANGAGAVPTGNVLGAFNNAYKAPTNVTPLNPGTISAVGASQPHENMQPYLTITFCIALQGLFPAQN